MRSWSKRGSTLFFFHLLTNVLFHFIQVSLARDDADGSCCMSARNVWQGVLHVREERLTRSTGRRVIQTPRREAFGTVGAGMPHVLCRCPGGIPAGMGALKFGVGTIILERDKRWALKTRTDQWRCLPINEVGNDLRFIVLSSPLYRKGKRKCVAMHKKGSQVPQNSPTTPSRHRKYIYRKTKIS